LQQGFQSAQNLYNNNTPQYYPGSTQAPMNSWQQAGDTAQFARGMAGSPVTNSADQNATDTLNGNYLSAGNPYFQNMANTIAQTVTPQVQSGFESTGRYGSGAAANATASALTNKIGDLAGQNYTAERGNQLQTMAMAPTLANQDFTNINQAQAAGNELQNQQQGITNADVNKFNYYQQLPYQQLSAYQQAISGNYGSQGSQSTPYYTNGFAGALSGAAGGAAAGSMFGPYGTAIGAGVGLLGSQIK